MGYVGDGNNDAYPMEKSDIGFTLFDTGTETCKIASSVILLDNNLGKITESVLWGRNIWENIQRF